MDEYETEEIMVCYGNEKGEYFYKPMGVKTMTKKVDEELKAHEDDNYIIAETVKFNVLKYKPSELDEEVDEKPNDDGYYTQQQCSFEVVPIKSGGLFRKRYEKTGAGEKTPFRDSHPKKEGEKSIVLL